MRANASPSFDGKSLIVERKCTGSFSEAGVVDKLNEAGEIKICVVHAFCYGRFDNKFGLVFPLVSSPNE